MMTGNKYQRLASRTIGKELTQRDVLLHSLHGMVGEIGEIHSIYQKAYQGHDLEQEHLKKRSVICCGLSQNSVRQTASK